MKRHSKIILKITVFLIFSPILGLIIFGMPLLLNSLVEIYPVSVFIRYPGTISLFAAVIPFSFALYQTIKLFGHVGKDKALSEVAAMALNKIKYCAIAVSTCYVVGFPLIFFMGDKDDAPGIVALGMLVFLASSVLAVYMSILQKRWHGNRGQ